MTEPRTLDEAAEQINILANALGQPPQAKACVQSMVNSLMRTATQKRPQLSNVRPRVLLLAGLVPQPGALGPGMLHGAMLEAVGATNALPKDAPDWLPLDLEAVAKIDPDVILLLNPDRIGQEAETALQAELDAAFKNLPPRVGPPRRLRLVSDPLAMIPSTNLPKLAQAMAEAIHQESGAPGNAGLQAR
jgi:ABC-type Fe3+-hydroxamate transport system substrate-binding protein